MAAVKDHLGNEYKTVEEMCDAHGVPRVTYYHRLQAGCSLSEALTIDGKSKIEYAGKKYRSLSQLLDVYGIPRTTYYRKLKQGKSHMEVFNELTEQRKANRCRA